MKAAFLNLSILLCLVIPINTLSQPASTTWKHYTYPDLNLAFDLPDDFVFEYPDASALGFVGHNGLTQFSLLVVKEVLPTREARRNKMCSLTGFTYTDSYEPNMFYGITPNGYDSIGTIGETEEEEGAVIVFLTDRKYSSLNFYINLTYGGEEGGETPAYKQAMKIANSISPIEK